jgi:hypothetical protein
MFVASWDLVWLFFKSVLASLGPWFPNLLCIVAGSCSSHADADGHHGLYACAGLFGYARFINHTGHVLRDVGAALLARSYTLMAFTALSSYNLLGPVTQGTIVHLKAKYGAAQYAAYEKKTPALFLPGVY